MEILQLDDVSYDYITSYGVTHAVRNVTATFISGKLYAISGRSGSGKSTLLSLIAGLHKVNNGNIKYLGKDISEMDAASYRMHKLGIIYQSFYLFPQLTALENIYLPLEFTGQAQDKIEKAMAQLKQVGLPETYAKKKPSQLSGGEQQRVAIARSLILDPALILGDEPTGNLDSENSSNIINLLLDLAHNQNKCVIIVTHSQEVCDAADYNYKMKDGYLQAI